MDDAGRHGAARYLVAGALSLDIIEHRVTLKGDDVPLGGRAFALLHALMAKGAALSSKDHLIREVWGGQAVSDAVLTTAVKELRKALQDPARTPVFIQTVHRRGYRFLTPVTFVSDEVDASPTGAPLPAQPGQPVATQAAGRHRLLVPAGILLACILAGAIYFRPSGAPPAPAATTPAATVSAPPAAAAISDNSIAVLPFLDFSATQDQGYFGDGIAEELLSVLARTEGLKVASRTSSFSFKARPDRSLPSIAQELSVRYIVEGSIRKNGDDIRVTAQLIDARNDKHLWSDSYDRVLNTLNIFAIQNEISQAILTVLEQQISLPGHGVGAPVQPYSNNVKAYEKYLEASALFNVRGADNISKSIRLYEEVVQIEPGFARAWSGLAAAAVVAPSWGLLDRNYMDLVFKAAEKAIQLDPALSMPYAVLAHAEGHETLPDFEKMVDLLNEAVKRDDRNTSALLWRGVTLQMLGYTDRAIRDFKSCLVVDPGYYNCRAHLERAYFNAGQFDKGYALWQENSLAGWGGIWPPLADHFARTGDRAALLLAIRNLIRSRPKAGLWMIDPMYRAYTDPSYDRETGYAQVMARLTAEGFKPEDDAVLAWWLWTAFGVYSEVRPLGQFYSEWGNALPDFAGSKERHDYIETIRLPAYWRVHGFPAGCKPVGDKDFTCQ